MKIFDVVFTNQKYVGEGDKTITVSARSISEALKIAPKVAAKREDIYGISNWLPTKVELVNETEN